MAGRKPQLAFVGPISPWRGGIAQYNTLLADELASRARVEFFSYSRQYPAWLYPGQSDREPEIPPDWERRADVDYCLDSLNPLGWLRLFVRLDRTRPDALVLTWSVPFWTPHLLLLGLLVRLFTGIRILFITHNVVSHDAGPVARLCSGLVLRLAHGHLVHAGSELRKLARLAPRARAVRANMPPHFPPMAVTTRAAARQQLKVAPCADLLLFFGFVRPYKGLPMALEALARPEAGQTQLLIAGEFWRGKAEIEAQIERLGLSGRVTLIDRYATPQETARYFSAADAVLLPYHSATGSGILPLAYTLGRPVIATRVGSFVDCVEQAQTGLLVEPNAQALACGIAQFFDGFDRERAPERIRAYLAESLSWQRLIDQLLGLI